MGAYLTMIWLFTLGGTVDAFTHPIRHASTWNQVSLCLCVLLFGYGIFRALRCGTLIATFAGVRHLGLVRNRYWDWSEIAHFEEVVGVIGANGIARRFLRVHLVSGRFRNLTELNASKRDDPDSIAELVDALEELRTRKTA